MFKIDFSIDILQPVLFLFGFAITPAIVLKLCYSFTTAKLTIVWKKTIR